MRHDYHWWLWICVNLINLFLHSRMGTEASHEKHQNSPSVAISGTGHPLNVSQTSMQMKLVFSVTNKVAVMRERTKNLTCCSEANIRPSLPSQEQNDRVLFWFSISSYDIWEHMQLAALLKPAFPPLLQTVSCFVITENYSSLQNRLTILQK